MAVSRSEVLQGTLDLMVLKTLDTMGPVHGYGIARRLEQISEGRLEMNQGAVYPALLRLQERGWIRSERRCARTSTCSPRNTRGAACRLTKRGTRHGARSVASRSSSALRDARFGVRGLARAPALTTVVVLSLALGIGANTAVFSVVNALMLKTLPVRDPDRLVLFGKGDSAGPTNAFPNHSWDLYSYPMFETFRRSAHTFQHGPERVVDFDVDRVRLRLDGLRPGLAEEVQLEAHLDLLAPVELDQRQDLVAALVGPRPLDPARARRSRFVGHGSPLRARGLGGRQKAILIEDSLPASGGGACRRRLRLGRARPPPSAERLAELDEGDEVRSHGLGLGDLGTVEGPWLHRWAQGEAMASRIQIIKGWVDRNGRTHEKIFDVALSDDRRVGIKEGKTIYARGSPRVDAKSSGRPIGRRDGWLPDSEWC
jgi:PadR family transcriptional regulator